MRAALVLSLCVACAGPLQTQTAAPRSLEVRSTVQVAAPPMSYATQSSGLSGCVVRGTGETSGEGTKPFRVFTSRTDVDPALIVLQREPVHVAWHDFPRAGTRGRVMALFGGQSLLRLDGYAELAGRSFQLTHRAVVATDHIWVRAGRVVELTGIDDGALVVSSPTEALAPKSVLARALCADVVYQQDALEPEADATTAGDEILLAQTAHLYDAPNGKQLMMLGTDYLNATKVEQRGGFARVVSSTGALAFDAWIRKREVVVDRGIGRLSGIGLTETGTSSCGSGSSRIGTVIRETPLRIGVSAAAPSTGWIERDARVDISQSVMLKGEAWVAVHFVSREFEPASNKNFWIAEADLRYD